ncbi:MAG: T9SS C-terminal target domain-containing protein, partial [Calditrichaeota bacterium]
ADLTWDGTHLYLLGLVDHVIYQIDTTDGTVLSTVNTGLSGAIGLTYREGYFWVSIVSQNVIKQVDFNGNVLSTLPIPTQQCIGMEWDGETYRIADSGAPDEKIVQVDTLGNLISSFLFPGDSPFGLTWDGSTVWCSNNNPGGVATIYQFDPLTGNVITSFPCPNGGGAANGLTWDGNYLWIADQTNNLLYQVEGNPIQPVTFGAISGRIYDNATGWGLGAVTVLDTQTDSSGYFLADSLAPGMYSFQVSVDGFIPIVVGNVPVTENDTTFVDVPLTPIGEPFEILLHETDNDEWLLRTYRDTTWRYYHIPAGRFRGNGIDFLDTPLDEITLRPVGGGGVSSLEITDWIDAISFDTLLIDNFESGNLTDWQLVIAYNGSYLDTSLSTNTGDGSLHSFQLVHGNTMGNIFGGWVYKTFSNPISFSIQDTVHFWLRGTPPYPASEIPESSDKSISTFSLKQNYPNPFNPGTTIEFEVPHKTPVLMVIYDLQGKIIRRLANQVFLPGRHRLYWDGTDDKGFPVSSGVYFYHLNTPNFQQSRKMLLLR